MRSAVLSFLGCLVASGLSVSGAEKAPNIVMIMCDDMGYEGVSAYGSPTYNTPHLDRLAAGGKDRVVAGIARCEAGVAQRQIPGQAVAGRGEFGQPLNVGNQVI